MAGTRASLAEENERLRQEIAILTRALAALEDNATVDPGPATASSDADPREAARRIFDLFDANHDGRLDAEELRQLAKHLGENVSSETWAAVGQDEWTFDHFYTWWSEPDEEASPSTTQSSDHTALIQHTTLSAIREKLRSQPYMRTVFRLMEKKAGQNQPSSHKGVHTDKGKDKMKEKDEPIDELREVDEEPIEDMCKINISAQVGPFERPACGATLSYAFSVEETTKFRKEYRAKENVAIISIDFSINEGVDDFELGELAGNLKNILLEAKPRLPFSDFKLQLVTEDGERIFKATLQLNHNTTIEYLTGALTSFQIKHLEAQLDLSESPLDEESSEFIRAHGHLSAIVPPSVVDWIQGFHSAGEDPRPNGHASDIIALFSALRDINLNLHFDDVGDLYRHAFSEAPAADLRGWQSARKLLTPLIRGALVKNGKSEIPILASAYAKVKKYLHGIRFVRLQLGANIISVKCHNLGIIALMPSLSELGISE